MSVGSSVYLMLAAVVVLATVASTRAQGASGVVFEPHSETCTLSSGKQGRCVNIRSCPSVLKIVLQGRQPVSCGFQERDPIVCCPVSSTDTVTEEPSSNIRDISTPDGYNTLNCGRSASKVTRFPSLGIPSLVARRKRAKLFPATDISVVAVVGGTRSERNAWPWMALLGKRDAQGINWFCAGVLINDQWVLSALHCFLKLEANVVRLGEHDYNSNTDGAAHEDFDVAETILYPGYNHPEAYHDLALLRLATKVKLKTFISPVCLPWGRESSVDLTGKKVTLTGWGDTLFGGSRSSVLQEVKVTVFPSSRCEESYSKLGSYSSIWPQGIGKETVCAGDPNGGRDACQGDSGGPITSQNSANRYTLAGIVSRGYGCGHKDYPGLYANVRNPPYLEWIKKVAF